MIYVCLRGWSNKYALFAISCYFLAFIIHLHVVNDDEVEVNIIKTALMERFMVQSSSSNCTLFPQLLSIAYPDKKQKWGLGWICPRINHCTIWRRLLTTELYILITSFIKIFDIWYVWEVTRSSEKELVLTSRAYASHRRDRTIVRRSKRPLLASLTRCKVSMETSRISVKRSKSIIRSSQFGNKVMI